MRPGSPKRIEMKISSNDFRVPEGDEVNLRKWPTNVKPVYKSKKHYKELLEEHVAQLSALQRLHYASNRYAVLLIFQAMDAAGKDGAIRHVMSGVNPQGCQVFSFKHPVPPNCYTIFCGAPLAICPNAEGSGSSTDPITRRC
jgi:polyphosphate kinase 2 (PPK2 family)